MKSTSVLGAVTALLPLSYGSPLRHLHARSYTVPTPLQSILDDANGQPEYTYPTDLTQGIIPKGIHSHNDYWRKVPFYTALSVGAISVEADVWFVNGTLYIGHDQKSLTANRTFDSLYVNPILNVLTRQNPQGQVIPDNTKYGVFDTNPSQQLYLFVDVKTDGATTWPAVVNALAPLRDGGYLTSYDGTSVTNGVVTVVGTGNTPLSQIQGVSPRDYFFDANLALLNSTQANITSAVSPIASTQFSRYIGAINGTQFSQSQLQTLEDQVSLARSKGIGARYWDTPAWPISTRNAVWRTLVTSGVTLLNADDLAGAAGYGGSAAW